MGRFFLLVIINLTLSLSLVLGVSAQSVDDPILKDLSSATTSDIPGITCGVADSPFANRCCKVSDVNTSTKDLLPDFACLEIPVPFGDNPKACISDIINYPINAITGLLGVDKIVEVGKTANTTSNPCTSGVPNSNSSAASCICKPKEASSRILCDEYLTSSASNKAEYSSCVSCANNKGVWTGIGCIHTNNVSSFIGNTVFKLGFGIAGGLALLCILYASFILQTSRGNPERIKKAKENLRACITGLLLIIFSVFILNLIGVSILRIPGLGN